MGFDPQEETENAISSPEQSGLDKVTKKILEDAIDSDEFDEEFKEKARRLLNNDFGRAD